MDKKATIGIIVVVAVLVIVGALIAVGMTSNNSETKTVTYDGNGGTCDGSATVTRDSSTIPDITWTNTGYTFVSYNDKKDGSGTSYNVGDSAPYGKTLYAQYVKSTSIKINIKDLPSYVNVLCNGVKVSNGDVCDDPNCKFTFIITTEDGYEMMGSSMKVYITKDSADVGTMSYSWTTHGGSVSVDNEVHTTIWRLVLNNAREFTLSFTASS